MATQGGAVSTTAWKSDWQRTQDAMNDAATSLANCLVNAKKDGVDLNNDRVIAAYIEQYQAAREKHYRG